MKTCPRFSPDAPDNDLRKRQLWIKMRIEEHSKCSEEVKIAQ